MDWKFSCALLALANLLGVDARATEGLPSIDAVLDAVNSGRPQDAVPMADKLITRFQRANQVPNVSYMCAESPAEEQANAATAKALNRMAVSVSPDWCAALYAKANALIDMNRIDLAEPVLHQAIAMAPNSAHYLNNLADHFRAKGQMQRAYENYAKAESLSSLLPDLSRNAVRAISLRGMALSKLALGDLSEAEHLFRESLKYAPNNRSAQIELADLTKARTPLVNTSATAETKRVSALAKSKSATKRN